MNGKFVLVIGLSIGIASCAKQPQSPIAVDDLRDKATQGAHPSPLPTPDTRSPDNAVKSYWALQDWIAVNQDKLRLRLDVSDEMREYMLARIALGTGEYLAKMEKDYSDLTDFSAGETERTVIKRDILEVRSESETRAVVVAKLRNVTPIPAGVDMSVWKEDRDYGIDVRYVLERTERGWRIAQAWKRDHSSMRLQKSLESSDDDAWRKVWDAAPPRDLGTSAFSLAYVEP